jgi:hypothetical protein
MAANTSAAFGHHISKLSRAKRLGYQALFRSRTIPRKQKRPADSSGRSFLQEEYTTAVKYFWPTKVYRSQSCMIAAQFSRAQKSQIVQLASLQNRVPWTSRASRHQPRRGFSRLTKVNSRYTHT